MIQCKHSLAILLSTYNGAKYLREQLDSLLLQSYKDWELYIRDDGSTDGTLSIISEYASRYSNIHFIVDNEKQKGPRDSFMHLLKLIDAQYYMFCDQDDIWLEDKIEKTFVKLKEVEIEKLDSPILVCSDLCVVDEKLSVISNSLWDMSKVMPSILSRNYKYLSVCNFVTGCTVMINNKVKQIAFPTPKDFPMHDYYLALCVSYKGGILSYINYPLILYRQHGNNSIGATEYPRNVLMNKILNFVTFLKVNRRLYLKVRNVVPISFAEYWCYKVMHFYYRFHICGKLFL